MKTLTELFEAGILNYYTEKAQRLGQLNLTLQAILGRMTSLECQVASFEGGQLTLVTPNSSCATMIRYLLPEVYKELLTHEEFKSLKQQIICKVMPMSINERPEQPKAQKLSAKTKELLTRTAEGITHMNLKASLLRLASVDHSLDLGSYDSA